MPKQYIHRMSILALGFVLAISLVNGQSLTTPDVSPRTTIQQTIGLTQTTLDYSRPNVKDRLVFGHLIPYGAVWRTGANAATLLSFDRPVAIADVAIPAGTYSLYTIPEADHWTWILNQDTTLWGARSYNPDLDLVRQKTEATTLPRRVETMHLYWANISPNSADLVLEWEYTRTVLPVHFYTDRQVEASIEANLTPDAPASAYYHAARYYLENGGDLEEAAGWMNTWLEKNGPQFGILRYKALIEYQIGEKDQAMETMRESLTLAREAGNDHYVRMNEQSLTNWSIPVVDGLSAKEVLSQSINYHDPESNWDKTEIKLSLYEQRPGSDYRLTHLTLHQPTSTFILDQQRGPNHIYRKLSVEGCASGYNGNRDLTEEEKAQFRLRCSDHETYANYYQYLWGLPMKLRDPGTIIAPTVWKETINGKEYLKIKVTYDPEVGGDIWYFYFHPDTYALSAYRFYHDESANDGEYILLEGEETHSGIRFPAKRSWYINADHRFLGYDQLLGY